MLVNGWTMRVVLSIAALTCVIASAATLEKLSLEQMSQKATLIVRGRVTSCAGDHRGSLIYTRCRMNVTEKWKGTAAGQTEFVIPGGTFGGLTQTFTGTPRFTNGDEYVLFLWAGKSGIHQLIGLSQGVFDVKATGNGKARAQRSATSELMLDAGGQVVRDEAVDLSVTELRTRVSRSLAAEGETR